MADVADTDNLPGAFPNYGDDEATFQTFIKEHEILTSSPDAASTRTTNDDGDDGNEEEEPLLEPGTNGLYRTKCFSSILRRIKNRQFYKPDDKLFIVEIPLDELMLWDGIRGADLANRATENTNRYQALFCTVIDRILDSIEATNLQSRHQDSVDILHEQRLQQQALRQQQQREQQQMQNNAGEEEGNLAGDMAMRQSGVTDEFPPILMRRYELRILPMGRPGAHNPFKFQHRPNHNSLNEILDKSNQNTMSGVSLRHIRSHAMGRLVTIRGMIVRSSDVKPCCVVATYTCDHCGCEIYQVVQNKREFMPQRICPSDICRQQNAKDSLHLQTRGSKFEKFQELKLQELPHQVPMGHVPRSMSVHCRGEMTRQATPGDVVTIDGIFLPQRVAESGYGAMKAGLISTTFLEAQNIVVSKKSYDDTTMTDSLSQEAKDKLNNEIMDIATGEDPVGRLSSSLAPEIYGHEDIKRALLLQLVSGVTRKLPDGMRIRGDINICLMGDPGVAKSQLLKHVASVAPRGVYTTGKGSSGVGLTAAITKDMATGEMALEGGALVLADQGICAIDEFDKMDESDRTAIHEVMEQQTVSVAKAGIVATLNARAAVLAAANPLYGRYNRKKSLSENVNLPNSLLSRFDLMFLILDIADVDKDMALARHVTFVHQNEGLSSKSKKASKEDDVSDSDDDMDDDDNDASPDSKVVPPEIVREYISRARKFQPVVQADVAPYIVEAYVGLRMQGTPGSKPNSSRGTGAGATGDQTVMTARQLLSILRLSQALARLRFSDIVAREDVDEAIRLTHMSKASLDEDYHGDQKAGGSGRGRKKEDVTSRIFGILKDYSTASRAKRIEVKLCEAMVLRKGFTSQQLKTCLEEYQALDVVLMNSAGTHIDFL